MTHSLVESIIEAGSNGNFDLFREHYNVLNFDERIEIGNAWDKVYPDQKHFNSKLIEWVVEFCGYNAFVFELGSHRGELAREALLYDVGGKISMWIGYDILKDVEGISSRFLPLPIALPFYELSFPFKDEGENAFVCSHTFEHMNHREVVKCIEAIKGVELMIFDIPITEEGQNWDGYNGSHVLKRGRRWFRELMGVEGYQIIIEISDQKSWQSVWREVK